jgi:PhzF family phenazine biosynthesis protein
MFEQFSKSMINTYHAFSVGETGGNSAAVIVSNDESVQTVGLAKVTSSRLDMEATLVVPPSDASRLAKLRFFVPKAEMAMCGHGTLAAMASLYHAGLAAAGNHNVETQAGVLALQIAERKGFTEVNMLTLNNKVTRIFQRQEIRNMQGIGGLSLASVVIVFLGGNVRAKTYIEVAEGCIDHLAPTPSQVQSICAAHATTGIYVFSRHPPSSPCVIEARHFPAGGGLYEDAATGVAAGGLACYLTDHFPNLDTLTIYQGRFMGNCSKLDVRRGDIPGEWWVGGQVRSTEDSLAENHLATLNQ